MSGTTVWTASVWGGAKSSALAPGGKLKEGEEECMICRGDVPASVGFKPCGHTVCFSCVENMRAKNIFKADKGVRCPFCRTFIEHYETLKASNNARAQELLQEANRAAAIAAAARSPAPAPAQAPVATFSVPREPENWVCAACNNSNLHWRTECNRCHKPDPRAKPGVRAKDVLKCTDEEIVLYINEKLHPHLNKAFLEAGTPYCQGRVTGTHEQIIAALKNKGEERLLRVVKSLVDSGHLHHCVVHFFGNYTIQDLLEATAKLRTATETNYQFMFDGFRANNRGLDPFGMLHYGMLPVCADCASHPQGTYVVQKVVELGTCWEVLQMTQRLVSNGPSLTADPRGIHVIAKCLQQLVALSTSGDLHPEVANVADSLCLGFWKMPDKMKYAAHHGLGAKILADAIQLGLPKFGALKLSTRICSRAQDYAASNSGLAIIIALLNVQPMAPGSAELVRDLVCLIAWSLQGHFKDYVMNQDDPRGPFLVEYCIKRLAEEQELAWIDAVIQELVGAGDVLVTSETALEVLKMALSLSVYDAESVEMHLQQLEELVGPEVGAQIEADVFARINSNGPPPAPKYFAPSYIQPDLKYHVVNGVRLAPVPQPPNKGHAVLPHHTRNREANSAASLELEQEGYYEATNGVANGYTDEHHVDQALQGEYGEPPHSYTDYSYPGPVARPHVDSVSPPQTRPFAYVPEDVNQLSPQTHYNTLQHSPESAASITEELAPHFGNQAPQEAPPPAPEPRHSGSSSSSTGSTSFAYRPPGSYPPIHDIPPQPTRDEAALAHTVQQTNSGITTKFSTLEPTPRPIPHPVPFHSDPAPVPTPHYNAPSPYSLPPISNSHLPPGGHPSLTAPTPFHPMPYAPPLFAPPQPYMPIAPRPAHNGTPVPRPIPVPIPVPVPVPVPASQAAVPKEAPTFVTHVVTPSKPKRATVAVPKPVPIPQAAVVAPLQSAVANPDPLPVKPQITAAPPVQPAPVAAPPAAMLQKPKVVASGPSWECKVCTYEHTGAESTFLVCAVCGSEKGAGLYGQRG